VFCFVSLGVHLHISACTFLRVILIKHHSVTVHQCRNYYDDWLHRCFNYLCT